MKIDEMIIPADLSLRDAMQRLSITSRRILFIAPDFVLQAVISDSDIRRFLLAGGSLNAPVSAAAVYHPCSLPVDKRRLARQTLREKDIIALPLLDKTGRIVDVEFLSDQNVESVGNLQLPVVMMAGGLGTRLWPYTKILPKPLIPVGETPISELIFQRFRGFGCREFHMVVNYKKNMIKSYFSEVEKDYSIQYADEKCPLGTGGGLSLLQGKLDKTFFLTNCDNIIEADYTDIYRLHKDQGNVITMICAVQNTVIPYGVVEVAPDGSIATMKEKPRMSYLANTGVYLVEPCVLDEIPADTACGFPDIIQHWREKGARVGVYPIAEDAWMDMGQMEALEDMRRRLEEQHSSGKPG